MKLSFLKKLTLMDPFIRQLKRFTLMTHLFQIIQEKATLIYLKNLSPIFSRISCELTETPAPWTFLKGQLLSSTTGGQGAAGGKMYTCGT